MFFRLLVESFRRQRRRKLLAGIAVFLGTAAVAAMLALATTIGDRIHRELAAYGANIVVTPQAAALVVDVGGVRLKPSLGDETLFERDLSKLQGIFWANNITGISPELATSLRLHVPGQSSLEVPALGVWFSHPLHATTGSPRTGVGSLHPWWRLMGAWPADLPAGEALPAGTDRQVVVGDLLARRLHLGIGDRLRAEPAAGSTEAVPLVVSGLVSTGDVTSEMLLLPLAAAQQMAGQPDAISRIDVRAKTRPEDAFARRNPETLSPQQRDIWYCRPYANSIAFQIREAIPGADAEQVRQVEQSEGAVLSRISGLMWLVSAAALIAAGFAVSSAIATAILERQGEIGLMRSLGASRARIAALFYVESTILALLAGTLGFLAGSALAAWLGERIFFFGATPAVPLLRLAWINPALLPIVLALALAVALLGSTPAIRRALRAEPSLVLRGAL